jgi:RNA-binding protein NOB1
MENDNLQNENTINLNAKHHVIDTSFFIKMSQISPDHKYYTTKYIIDEIRDENAVEYYELNKQFIEIITPTNESFRKITEFCKKSQDLFNLSVPDLSVMSLAYELLEKSNKDNKDQEKKKLNEIRETPIDWKIIKLETKKKPKVSQEVDDDGFKVVVEKNCKKKDEDQEEDFAALWGNEDGEWINDSNIDQKLSKFKSYVESKVDEKNITPENYNFADNLYVITEDFTIQNVCLKIGFKCLSVNGLAIKQIKNFILKCYSCNHFNHETEILFCQECGYNTLMRIGYKINDKGEGVIFDKDAEYRHRGVQFDIPKQTVGKKSTVYIMSEDQIPKNYKNGNKILSKGSFNVNIDRILKDYDEFKGLNGVCSKTKNKGSSSCNFKNDFSSGNSTKNYVWAYPSKNPNKPKNYYGKKQKNS